MHFKNELFYVLLYVQVLNMASKKKTNPLALMGYEIDNKIMSEMKKKKETTASSVQFRNDILESQKRINYQNDFDRIQGDKQLTALHPNAKSRMKELQNKARQSLIIKVKHIIYTELSLNLCYNI